MATKAATAQNVDFSNVKDAGQFNPKQVPMGDYLAEIVKVEDGEAKDKTFMWVFTIKLKRFSSYAYPYYCKLQENQLWKLRNLAVAAGLAVPKKRVKLDPNRLIGKTIGVTMEDDEYEGKLKSVIAAVFPAAELADGAVVDDEPEDDVDSEEDVDEPEEEVEEEVEEELEEEEIEEEPEDEADEFAEMNRDQLKSWLRKNIQGYSIKRSQSDDDLREVARQTAGGAEETEEEEPEAAPEPPKRAAKKAPAASSRTRRKPAEVTDDELEELDIDDL